MSWAMAFEVTAEDVRNVLEANNGTGDPDSLFELLDTDAITKAALDSGDDLDEQIIGAYGEIASQLEGLGAI